MNNSSQRYNFSIRWDALKKNSEIFFNKQPQGVKNFMFPAVKIVITILELQDKNPYFR
jgi:hypothetical protein